LEETAKTTLDAKILGTHFATNFSVIGIIVHVQRVTSLLEITPSAFQVRSINNSETQISCDVL
jgi:hypothetical protein